MPMDRGTPDLVRHCVAAVAKQYGGDTSKAFAICVASLQKAGYLKPGTMELTAAGKQKEKEHEAEPDFDKKMKSYEKLLKANRKEEDYSDFERLMNPTSRTGMEHLPMGSQRRWENRTAESPMEMMQRLAGISTRFTDRSLGEADSTPEEYYFTNEESGQFVLSKLGNKFIVSTAGMTADDDMADLYTRAVRKAKSMQDAIQIIKKMVR